LLRVTAEALRTNIGSKSAISLHRGPVDPKFQVDGIAPTNHSSSQKTRLNDLSYGIKIWTNLCFILSQITRLTDGQTDGLFLTLDRVCISCSAVKALTLLCSSQCTFNKTGATPCEWVYGKMYCFVYFVYENLYKNFITV